MSRFVVDASIAIKWFVPEVQSDAALAFLNPENELIAPDLLLPEAGNIIWKKIRAQDLTMEQGREVVRGLSAMPVRLCSAKSLFESAVDLACRVGCTVYDATYVVLAVARDCKLLSADRRLLLKFESSAISAHFHLI